MWIVIFQLHNRRRGLPHKRNHIAETWFVCDPNSQTSDILSIDWDETACQRTGTRSGEIWDEIVQQKLLEAGEMTWWIELVGAPLIWPRVLKSLYWDVHRGVNSSTRVFMLSPNFGGHECRAAKEAQKCTWLYETIYIPTQGAVGMSRYCNITADIFTLHEWEVHWTKLIVRPHFVVGYL